VATKLRRSPHIVSYWSTRGLVYENYETRLRTSATTLATEILDFLSRGRTLAEIRARFSRFGSRPLAKAIVALQERSLIEPVSRNGRGMDAWAPWNPAAGFFHFSTKDVPFVPDYEEGERLFRAETRSKPQPPAVKRYPRSRSRSLPPPQDGPLADLLRGRRTWRRFSRQPVEVADLATLLGLTFGIQGWMPLGELGRVPLKTSPSGGARHSIEAYLLARRVKGLAPGLYHYAPDRHGLALLKRGAGSAQIERYLPTQWWYRGAAAAVFMTSVFPRVMWRYDYPRAYRAVLIEAGHLCQTFLLVATWLGLAPFCSMALADSRIEQDLGVDGVTESVLYAAGVGTRPPGVESAQAPARRRRR
jgi:SagB-type dehydrogenase family enzyme